MTDYDFVLTHKPEKTLVKANTLSKTLQFNKREYNNKNVTLLKPKWFIWDITMNFLDLKLV